MTVLVLAVYYSLGYYDFQVVVTCQMQQMKTRAVMDMTV